ncbi:MAG TPA: hypothetical protein PK131_02020 [Candidatus Woesebacteria bacterium]|mgnify:CR=1 FL=1|nr:hypothetical protein [Candidatus Woesebacteria bacterium]
MALFKPIVLAAEGLGKVTPPPWLGKWIKPGDEPGQGLFYFLSVLLSLAVTIAGIYLVFQFIFAGYMYLSAGGDPKKVELAGAKLWQSLLGLVIVAASLTLAGVITRLTGISIFKFTF